MMPTEPSNRLAWLDCAKGIGICLVVFGHAANGMIEAGLATGSGPLAALHYIVYTFHMPLFFFAAGVTAKSSYFARPAEFLTGKLIAIGYPYLIWSVIQGVIRVQMGSLLNHPISFAPIATILLVPIDQFWFLYSLLICMTVATSIQFRTGPLVAIALLALGIFGLFDLSGVAMHITLTLYHFAFFAGGIILADTVKDWHPDGKSDLRAAIAAGIAFSLMMALCLISGNVAYTSLPILPAAILAMTLVIWACKLLSGHTQAGLAFLGRLSLSIYMLHLLFTGGVRIVLMKMGLTHQPLLLAAAITTIAIAAPIAIHLMLERLGLLTVSGLSPFRRAGRRPLEGA